MSGLRPYEMNRFYSMLAARGLDTATLAEQVGVSRPALCRVFNGSRRRGPIWRRVAPLLTEAERALLDVAQCHPWNRKRLAGRPRWAKVAKHFQGEPERVSA